MKTVRKNGRSCLPLDSRTALIIINNHLLLCEITRRAKGVAGREVCPSGKRKIICWWRGARGATQHRARWPSRGKKEGAGRDPKTRSRPRQPAEEEKPEYDGTAQRHQAEWKDHFSSCFKYFYFIRALNLFLPTSWCFLLFSIWVLLYKCSSTMAIS